LTYLYSVKTQKNNIIVMHVFDPLP
jgi:hypothetical protein